MEIAYYPNNSNSRHSAKKDVGEHRYAGQPMPSAVLLPGAWHSAKKSFAESLFCRVQFFAECGTRQRRSLPSARFLHSAKNFALGKVSVSSSD